MQIVKLFNMVKIVHTSMMMHDIHGKIINRLERKTGIILRRN